MSTVTDFNDYTKTISTASPSNWTNISIPFDELAQAASWGITVAWDAKKINAFAWEMKGPTPTCPVAPGTCTMGTTPGISTNTGNLAIKDFKCTGTMPLPTKSTICGKEITPVVPKFVASNGIIAMNKGVNLQVTNNATLQIFDLKGKVVRTLKFAQGSHVVSLSDLPRGLYIVKASSASWQRTVKMTVN
jgi:hypothetical protein